MHELIDDVDLVLQFREEVQPLAKVARDPCPAEELRRQGEQGEHLVPGATRLQIVRRTLGVHREYQGDREQEATAEVEQQQLDNAKLLLPVAGSRSQARGCDTA